MKIKYSIIIPVNNVINYLPDTIQTIISQNYDSYELIISDDNSTDGTAEYIDTLTHPSIKAIHTPIRMTSTEHFDWALTYATGEWCMFVGGDDGLQPYFFKLADKLTAIAKTKNICSITSKRSFYFWNGCQSKYGDVSVSYEASSRNIEIRNIKKQAFNVLYSQIPGYFEIPQMYTNSLFHFSLIKKTREIQNGKFLKYAIPDANMAAISTSNESYYLYSHIPLGWVGTSPKVLTRSDDEIKHNYKIPKKCGNYRLGILAIYFWGALLTVNTISPNLKNKLTSKTFIKRMSSNIYIVLSKNENFIESKKYQYFLEFLQINDCRLNEVIKTAKYIKFKKYFLKILNFQWKCIRHVLKKVPLIKNHINYTNSSQNIYITWKERPTMTMQNASELVMDLINKNINFEDISI